MIDNVTRPQCYSAFYARPKINIISENNVEKTPTKVKVGSFVGSAICALGATALIAKNQSKLLKKPISMFNIKYDEANMIGVASSALAGGLVSGMCLDEHKYRKAKIHEAIHQAVANILCPIALVGILLKGYSKISSNIKLPQFKETSATKKFLNNTIQIIPNLAVTAVGLVSGVVIGTKIANKINGEGENTFQERKVKPLDFIYHPDDVAAAFALADRKGSLQKIVGKIIPPVFMLHGYEAGTSRGND